MKYIVILSVFLSFIGCANQETRKVDLNGHGDMSCSKPLSEYNMKIINSQKENKFKILLPEGVGENNRIECKTNWYYYNGKELNAYLVNEGGVFEVFLELPVTDNSWSIRGAKIDENILEGKFYHESWGANVAEGKFEIYR